MCWSSGFTRRVLQVCCAAAAVLPVGCNVCEFAAAASAAAITSAQRCYEVHLHQGGVRYVSGVRLTMCRCEANSSEAFASPALCLLAQLDPVLSDLPPKLMAEVVVKAEAESVQGQG